jgi:uncharacterized protein
MPNGIGAETVRQGNEPGLANRQFRFPKIRATIYPAMSTPIAPIDTDERLHALDVLRGFALFGMILVHFHQKTRLETTGFEDLIAWGVWIFVEQKAWGTFALLFGAGFAILLRRLEARQAPVLAVYVRRLATLAIFGIVAQVGFGFQILFQYASWGIALLVIRRWPTRVLLATAVVAACARPVTAEIVALWHWSHGLPMTPPSGALEHAVQVAAQGGDYFVLLSARWALFAGTFARRWQDFLPDMNLALFTLGLLAVRHRVFDEPTRHVRLIVGWMIFGAVSWGLSWAVLFNLPPISIPGAGWPITYGFGLIQDQWLCLTYTGAVVLLLAFRVAWLSRLRAFARAGRMALTNYMFQAIALDVLSSGYGFNLKLRPYTYVVAAVALFAVEATFSTLWLSRFRFGPLEWIWRTITYARLQSLRRPVSQVAPVSV